MTDSPAIKLVNVIKQFRNSKIETTALNEISFEIAQGEFVAITGPSGCGKSTLLNVIGLLDVMGSGEYELLGKRVDTLGEFERNRLRREVFGFVFQAYNLIDDITVQENVELVLKYAHKAKAERQDLAFKVLEEVGLDHRCQHFPNQLSGGQQQRVAIARAICSEPKILLADEPTGNLDSEAGASILDMLEDLSRSGTTVVMVTHDQVDAARADRLVALKDGAIEFSAVPA